MNSTLKEVYCFWSSLRCIECWIVIYCRGLKFPQKAVVLLLLESDAACTSLNGHCAWKCAVLVFEYSFKASGGRVQDLRRYWPPEGCIKKWYGKHTGVLAGGAIKQWCCISYLGQAVWHIEWKHNVMILKTVQNLH